jgi:transcription elongation factor GreA-like protein
MLLELTQVIITWKFLFQKLQHEQSANYFKWKVASLISITSNGAVKQVWCELSRHIPDAIWFNRVQSSNI